MKDGDRRSSSIRDGVKGPADSDVDSVDQGCRVRESNNVTTVHAFLTQEDIEAIDRLDGTIGR